jgi:CDP-diacylglycerol--glycerol-3-phosphate 3-phosphatidyltransferase
MVPVHLIAVVGIYYMASISILTAIDYFVAFWRKIERATTERRSTDNAFVLSRKKKNSSPPAHNASQL